MVAVENLTSSMVQQEDEKNAVELKGMMSNLKSKFSFLDPASNEAEQRTIPSQIAMLEEKFTQISKMVMDQEGMHNKT